MKKLEFLINKKDIDLVLDVLDTNIIQLRYILKDSQLDYKTRMKYKNRIEELIKIAKNIKRQIRYNEQMRLGI